MQEGIFEQDTYVNQIADERKYVQRSDEFDDRLTCGLICGDIGCALAWNPLGKDRLDTAEYYHAKLLMRCGILASFCAFVVGLLRILMPKAKNSRRCRILQFGSLVTAFVSILASVAAWADYLRHDDLAKSAGFERQNFAMWPLTPNAWSANGSFRIGEIRRAAKSLFETHAHHSPTILLGWAYWFSVASVLFLFFANLLYLMRKDCKTDQHNQSFVPNRRTGYF
ncbi:hypothetical protein X801_05302 [Opisthorchis viverrini]|uniref:Transmembrane protein n=1 Tax=Opisthorchis viverrini TaxID=6198 RepID=A0A1S8WWC3_OPIVI|nr:hypothetical protein X801_05302 [Opisthorchis viverrini]